MPRSVSRVLLVDDDDAERELFRLMLQGTQPPLEVVEAPSLLAARVALLCAMFDCVVLDHQLGGSPGLELLPDIAGHRIEVCPVIVVTNGDSEDLLLEAMRRGASDVIGKVNVSATQLRVTIERALKRAAVEQARREADERIRASTEALRREHESSLRAALTEAHSANRAKSRFVANMSHEIRTPLNAVIGLAYLLERTALDAAQFDLVAKIKLAGRSLLETINDVLDASKIESQELVIETAAFDLRELLTGLGQFAGVQIGARPLAFRIDCAPNVPVALQGDALRLRQILLNLVTNAIKFTERGNVTLTIDALTPPGIERVMLRFAVIDTGIGIAPEVLNKQFLPFVQADASTTRRFGGTGLGLSIASELVMLMDGTIGATSTPDVGSEFWTEIPFGLTASPVLDEPAPERPANAGPAPNDGPSANAFASPIDGERLSGTRVLLVDDSEINLEVARAILELEGALVETARDGREGVDRATASPDAFDIVLMDLQMPVLDGHGAFRELVARLGEARPVVLALTAGSTALEGVESNGPQMDGVVLKPFDVDTLVSAIRANVRPRGSTDGDQIKASLTPPAPATPEWPVFPGIDGASARFRLDGNLPLYLGSLRRLLDENADLGGGAGLTMSGADTLARRLHRLKGNAGLLGITVVHDLAAQAEQALSITDEIAVTRLLAEVQVHLERLRLSLVEAAPWPASLAVG